MKKRLLKFYKNLFHNPRALFPPGPNGNGAAVTLWPNGQNEIWIQDENGHGYRIEAGQGPAGFSLRVSTMIGSAPMTLAGNRAGDYECFSGIDARHLEICQYKPDAKAQAFKAWYQADTATRGEHPSFSETERDDIVQGA